MPSKTCESLSVKLAADKETASQKGKYDSRIQTLQKEYNKLFREINKGNDEVIVRAPHDNNKKEEIKDNKKDIKKDDKNINEKKNENEIKCNICDKYHIISKESVSSNECIIL